MSGRKSANRTPPADLGVTMSTARFPRLYIDPNRGLEDIDPLLLDAPWPEPVQPGPKSRLGIGLVWRLLDGQPVYAQPLSPRQLQQRIDACWRPYHAALQRLLDEALAVHGRRWHLNVHSMPDDSHPADAPRSEHRRERRGRGESWHQSEHPGLRRGAAGRR